MFSGKWRRRLCAAGLMLASAGSLASAQEASPIPARFINAETGAEVPAAITLSSRISPAGGPVRLRSGLDGGKSLSGPAGHHSVEIRAAGYHAMTAPVELGVEPVLPLVFRLQPEQPPSMARPESILARVRPDAALVQGFVTDSDSGALLAGVRVQVVPSGVETASDARGYFELFVPVPPGPEQPGLSLRFSSPGYRSEMRRQVELWPNGDWTYRIRLSRGTGEKMVEERETRRWSGARAGSHAGADGASAKSRLLIPEEPLVAPASTLPSNATARVPRTIRILHNNVVQYETIENYCRFSLPSEWIPSWGAYPGGSNSLQAGAVAVRTYAIGFVNQPLAATYDICATTACQVYNPDISNSRTDQAVSQTAGFVMVNSSGHIPRALTEYSSENNQLNSPCGDGFTAPSAECRADPVCAGEPEFGHGRGMCQWGSAKWATGLKFPGNNFSNPTLMNGQPRRDWAWILEHYYPGLVLVRGAPLMIGDSVRSTASANVRACPGDTIINGVNCPAIGTASAGATGVIAGGPIQVFADGSGYTWWNVQWSSGVTGWVVENYLARSIPLPSTPLALAASPLSTSRIRLTWVDPSDAESGFKIEQALSSDGLWTEIAATGMNATSHVITNLNARTAYLFRIRAFNLGGHSPYSAVASATTPGDAIALRNIPDQFVDEEATLAFTAAVTGHEIVQTLADFEAFTTPAANGALLFRAPSFSGSTSSFLETSPNVSTVTGAFPAGNGSLQALAVSCSFNSDPAAWLRLTTFGAATLPNPVIDFRRRLRFSLYADRALAVGLGLRETTHAAGTLLGSDGGTSGAIEWVGVTNRINGQPRPTRTVAAGVWSTLEFNLPSEPAFNYVNGDGVLSTPSSLGVLEHIALVPRDGPGVYNVFLDTFEGVEPRPILFSLEPGAPTGAAVEAATGRFSWTPTERQGPSTNVIALRATSIVAPPESDVINFKVVVNEVNRSPVLAANADATVHAGATLVVANRATDPDWPPNRLTFSLLPPIPAGAGVDPMGGQFAWTPSDDAAGGTQLVTIQVRDDGAPSLGDVRAFSVRVMSRPAVTARRLAEGEMELRWSTIPGTRYQAQFRERLETGNWIDLGPVILANDFFASLADAPSAVQRFYRVRLFEFDASPLPASSLPALDP